MIRTPGETQENKTFRMHLGRISGRLATCCLGRGACPLAEAS